LANDLASPSALRRGRRRCALGRDLGIPGSPFAIATDDGGTVLAKGTRSTTSPAGERPGDGGAAPCLKHLDRITDAIARDISRRGFLARVGGALVALTAARTVGTLIGPADSEAFHSAGTPSPPAPARIDRTPADRTPAAAPPRERRQPVDDIGRPVNDAGQPV